MLDRPSEGRVSAVQRPMRRDAILKAMGRMAWRDYGPRAYQVFVVANPAGRVPGVERLIARALRSAAR